VSEALVLEHLPLARRIASAMARRLPMPRDDIESAAMLGLVQAARDFDVGKGAAFNVYADRRIRGAIQDEARAVDVLTRDQRRAVKQGAPDALEPRHEDFSDLEERIAGRRLTGSVEDWASARDFHRHLRYLPRRLQMIVRRHLIEEISLAAIGAEMGVTESRVCQLLGEAKERLRVRLQPAVVEAHRRPRGGKHGQPYCPNGHDMVGYNVTRAGHCRRCHVERLKRRRRAKGMKPLDAYRRGPHVLRKLTAAQVREVLAAIHAGERVASIARRFDVARLVVTLIRDGKTYRDVSRPAGYVAKRRPIGKLTSVQAQEIRRRLEAGAKNRELAREFGVSDASISDLRHARHHRRAGATVALDDARHRRSPRARLSDQQVREVRVKLAAKVPIAAIARSVGLAWSTIRCLRDGRTYRRVPG
jgi:RNA polymerase sigma factor for flagellar operon FliA